MVPMNKIWVFEKKNKNYLGKMYVHHTATDKQILACIKSSLPQFQSFTSIEDAPDLKLKNVFYEKVEV